MPFSTTSADEPWPTAMATVLECHYDIHAGRAIAFGLPSGKNFRIRYNYNAGGAIHEGEFYSATAMPQNTLFPIRYDPAATHDHTHEHDAVSATTNPRRALLVIGIVGSLILSLAWLVLLRGCH